MLWALADAREDGLLVVEHPYFETAEPIVWDEGDQGRPTSRRTSCSRRTSPTSGTTASARSSPR